MNKFAVLFLETVFILLFIGPTDFHCNPQKTTAQLTVEPNLQL